MINTPVSKSVDYDNEFIYDVDLFDADGNYICLSASESVADELTKIINNHYRLIKSLSDMVEVVGGNFCQNVEIKSKYKDARELLEKCK